MYVRYICDDKLKEDNPPLLPTKLILGQTLQPKL